MGANFLFLSLGTTFIAPPDGVDPQDINSIRENIHLYEAKHFIVPLIAHSLQALLGGFIAAKFSASKHLYMALVVGFISWCGGLSMVAMLPEQPTWVWLVDLTLCYFPMAYMGWKFSGQPKG